MSKDTLARNPTYCYLGKNQLARGKFRLGAFSAAELLKKPVGCSVLSNCTYLSAENHTLLD